MRALGHLSKIRGNVDHALLLQLQVQSNLVSSRKVEKSLMIWQNNSLLTVPMDMNMMDMMLKAVLELGLNPILPTCMNKLEGSIRWNLPIHTLLKMELVKAQMMAFTRVEQLLIKSPSGDPTKMT